MKKAIIVIIAILVIIQFFRIDKSNPPANMEKDFITITNPPTDMGIMLKESCYDCHSHHTKYPWYSNIAPVSWLLKEHVNNGRNHLNFSVWTDYKESKKNHKLDECIEMIETGEMPMKGYVLLHEEADLTDAQKKAMIDWFRSVKVNN
jgi:hypothetical protein